MHYSFSYCDHQFLDILWEKTRYMKWNTISQHKEHPTMCSRSLYLVVLLAHYFWLCFMFLFSNPFSLFFINIADHSFNLFLSQCLSYSRLMMKRRWSNGTLTPTAAFAPSKDTAPLSSVSQRLWIPIACFLAMQVATCFCGTLLPGNSWPQLRLTLIVLAV